MTILLARHAASNFMWQGNWTLTYLNLTFSSIWNKVKVNCIPLFGSSATSTHDKSSWCGTGRMGISTTSDERKDILHTCARARTTEMSWHKYLGVYKTVRLLIKPSSFLPHSRTESCKSCQQRPLSACLSGLSMNQSSSLGYRPSLLVPASAMEPVPSAVVIGNEHPHEAEMISVDCDE